MKKLISLLLALAMLMALTPAMAEEAEAALPQVGDVVYGFEAVQVREAPMVGARITLFEHQKTGAQVMYIANEDTFRVFDLSFFTRAIDNTGLPHVFEHSTLDGSEKYPSKALFFNVSAQTYNTYMNAYTDQNLTGYPVASLSEAQLLKLADYYTDSCLHPMIGEDESIYREEAWRYRLADPEDELTIEGTVYSEMLGAYTLSRAADWNLKNLALPGSMAANEPGGLPSDIPNMTYEALMNYHDLYYHPSNSICFLYGQFDDYTAFLKLLDDAYAPYEKREFTFEDPGYTPITEPQEQAFPFPVEAGSDTQNAANIYYALVCPGLKDDPQEEMVLNTLTDLLIVDGSDMMQALKTALPTGQFYTWIETNGPDDMIMFVALNVNAEDAQTFKTTVDAELAKVAENGFPQDVVDSVMASLAISMLQPPVGTDIIDEWLSSLASSYAASGNPFDYLDYVDALTNLDDWNQQGLYAAATQKWLVGSQLTALATTYPEPGQKEAEDEALRLKLAEIKDGMTDEEIAAIVESSNAPMEEEDTSEMVASLQAVTVESLPEEIKTYELRDETDDSGVRHVDAVAGVDGIGMAALFLNADGIPQDDIHFFHLFADIVGEVDTSTHNRQELAVLIQRYLYGVETRLSMMGEGADYYPRLRLGWTAMDEDLEAGYDLMYELVFDSQFTDLQRVGEYVKQRKASLKSAITGDNYRVALYRALGVTNPLYRYMAYYNYVEYYDFLSQLEAVVDAGQTELIAAKLQEMQEYFRNRAGAIAVYAGSEDGIAVNRPLVDAFMAKLDQRDVERVAYDLPVASSREALVIDSSVQYNVMVADYASLGLEGYDAGMDALASMIQDMYLLPQLRDQYGAYGAFAGAIDKAGMYLISYRDPNVRETFDVYDGLSQWLSGLEVDQDTLNGYILSAYTYYAQSAGELEGALTAAVNMVDGESQEKKLEFMRQLKDVTPETLENYAEVYKAMSEKAVRSTVGGMGAISANEDLYEAVLNPFGSVDASQVAFDDLPEDHANYEAVRFVFEEGLMAPAGETEFGVDQAATVGDLCSSLYVIIGGDMYAPEDGLATLAQYGIVSADAQVDDELTWADCEQTLAVFTMAIGMEYTPDAEAADEVMTRGELAQKVLDYYNGLMG